jgi:exopolyphosphatase/guanosine-5'-triphosphate,3'-diphosphate pyrophosphatase
MNPERVRHETGILLVRHEVEPEHTLHVAGLADQIFSGLSARHGLGTDERLLLECAASLHDIGWAITQPEGKAHHKATACMIREYRWTSLTRDEVRIVAAVARYHRKALPSEEHPEYVCLTPENKVRTRWMAACLRVADGLDRRHLRRVRAVAVRDAATATEVHAVADSEIGEELVAARRKSDLLAEVLGKRVAFLRAG